jgi:hypothetical protein
MAPRTAVLSSTTRIQGVKGDGIKEETTSVSFLGQYEFSLISVYCAPVAERHSAGVEQLRRESLPDPYQDFTFPIAAFTRYVDRPSVSDSQRVSERQRFRHTWTNSWIK